MSNVQKINGESLKLSINLIQLILKPKKEQEITVKLI